ncbi:hypothetical protein ACFE04_030995 [Oxalis oulophora]
MASTLSTSVSAPPNFCFDEKWKLSKKEGSSSSSSKSCNNSSTTTMKKKNSSSSSSLSSSNKTRQRCSFTRKCARLVKEQRARFYIMRRCVTMLICWRDYSDNT